MAEINLLEDYYSVSTNAGVISANKPIPNGATRFELWYKISNYKYNPLKDSQITITFKSADRSNTTGITYYPSFYLIVNENTEWVCITFDLPRTVVELAWITLNGEYQVAWEMYVKTVEATVSVDKGLEYDTAGKLNVKPSTAEDSTLLTTSKNLTGAINEVFTYTADAFNTFANSIKSKGGTVSKSESNYTKSEINSGILSITSGSGSGAGGIGYVDVTTKNSNLWLKYESLELIPDEIRGTTFLYPRFTTSKYATFWKNVLSYSFFKNITSYESGGKLYIEGDYGIGNAKIQIVSLISADSVFPTFNDSYRTFVNVLNAEKTVISTILSNDYFLDNSWILSLKIISNRFYNTATGEIISTNKEIKTFRIYAYKNSSTSQMFGIDCDILPYTNNGYFHIIEENSSITKREISTENSKFISIINPYYFTSEIKELTGFDTYICDNREYTGVYQETKGMKGLVNILSNGTKKILVIKGFLNTVATVYDFI